MQIQKVEKVSKDQNSPYMPGRLKSRIDVWRQTTSDLFVLSLIDGGYRISWNDYGPPPSREQGNSPNCKNHIEFKDKSISDVVKMEVVYETFREFSHNISPLKMWMLRKVMGKEDSSSRLCLLTRTFKFLSSSILNCIRRVKKSKPGSKIGFVLDISQAFYHIEIHPQFYKYLGLMWNDRYYCWR